MIASVHFKNFKALRSTAVKLEPFNLVLGPNGSGKTSLIQALLRLRSLAALPVVPSGDIPAHAEDGPVIEFQFVQPYQGLRVSLGCNSDEMVCNQLRLHGASGPERDRLWSELGPKLRSIRAYLFDHHAMAVPSKAVSGTELTSNGGNLAAVLADWQEHQPALFVTLEQEFIRLMPEFSGLRIRPKESETLEWGAVLAGAGQEVVTADNLSQGTLYLLAILVLAFSPQPPAVLCLEEADRGLHPRTLRELRDTLYRLSYPQDLGLERPAVQVIATTHSPYLLDQFKEHPDEVVLASKRGTVASLERLSDRTDLLDLMKEANLGDLWYSGILGGVPEE